MSHLFNMKQSRIVFGILIFSSVFGVFQLGIAKETKNQRLLSELRTYNRVILLVKEQYVSPERFDPRAMLLAALDAVEQKVPEVVVSEPIKDEINVQVGKKAKNFSIAGLTSLWDLSFKLRDIFRFVESDLPPDIDAQEVEYAAANGTLSKLDPHSILLEPKFSNEMKLTTRGEFGGLGIVIGVRDGFLTVISPLEGTPADKVGIKALDRIVKINEDSTINLGLDEAVEQLRGKPGTKITLTVQRKGEADTRRFVVTRDIIKVDSVSSELVDNKLGYIKVKAFHGNTARDMKAAIDSMQLKTKGKLAGLILDFRNNPGGLLDQSVAIADLFLDGGVVVVTRGAAAQNREEERASQGQEKTQLPIVVLVNGGSASASEIVAGAIKNRDRGIVIGEQTFGKGSVQMLYDFPDKSALKLTIAQYLTPGDESIQSVGITPDIVLRTIFADKKETISLFPENRTREEDLESHLDDKKRVIEHKPVFELAYLSEHVELDEVERRSISSKYREDYEISFAKKLLLETQGASREALLKAAEKIVEKARAEESEHLYVALKKLGIDWSSGKPGATKTNTAKPTIAAKVVSPASARAGETLKIVLEVKNTGTSPVFRTYGISDSATPLFADQEFLFGKLAPAETRTWSIDVKIPKDALSRRDLMRVILKGNDQENFGVIDVPIVIEGLPRPTLAYTYYLDDTQSGNGDGHIQVGEKADLVLFVKNTGPGVAEEPWALLKNLSGTELFIDEGRQKIAPLKPGDVAIQRLSFTLRGKIPEAKLQVQVYDAVMGDFWSEKINLPVKQDVKLVKKSGNVEIVKDKVALRATPDDDGVVLAYLSSGQLVPQVTSVAEYTRIRVSDDLKGFIANNDFKESSATIKPKAKADPKTIMNYRRVPPKIELASGKTKPIVAKGSYRLSVQVSGEGMVRDAFLFVNDQKVYYKSFDAKQSKLGFESDIKLKPGVNVVTMVAREDDDYGQRESVTIFSEVGDPLAEKSSRH